jgi:hypothetical protein
LAAIEDHWELGPGQLESTHEQCLPRTDSFVLFVPFVVKRKDANSVGASLDISYFSACGALPTTSTKLKECPNQNGRTTWRDPDATFAGF